MERDFDAELREAERACGFDPSFLCICCNEPVGALSCGGPMICPACDCGYNRDGTQWDLATFTERMTNAKRRRAAT